MSEIASELELKALRAMEKAMIKNAELQAKLDMAIEALEKIDDEYAGCIVAKQALAKIKENK